MKHEDVISQLTREEKASLTSGLSFWQTKSIDRLGISSVTVSDGPHGLRKQESKGDHLGLRGSVPATSFPTAATLANSWDDQLLFDVGEAIASEAVEQGVDVILGPGLNIKRNPLGGRNFEYFSEDPYLAGTLAGAFIRGAQSIGVGACPKHFAVNSQETRRMSVDEVVDEKALHEIYLEGFRIALGQGSPWMLMSSYNQVNGEYAHQNPYLISDVLRGQWGYDGVVVSDWGGNVDSAQAAAVGSNLEMPASSGVGEARVLNAVENGELDEAVLDHRIDEFLTLVDRITQPRGPKQPLDMARQHEIARSAAEESLVLLRNVDGALPLNTTERVAVIGSFADVPRYQGAGSSLVNPTRVVSALDALKTSGLNLIGYEPGFKRADKPSRRLAGRALNLAEHADTILLFLGLDEGAESEGVDRPHMRLARNQLALTRDLIRQAEFLGTKIVVVLAGGSPVELPFAENVDAILHSYLAGQAGGQVIADVLVGNVNPSGRLAESYPFKYRDVASSDTFALHQASAEHRESIYVGYRQYDKVGQRVRYPFGFGLSYTEFTFSDPAIVGKTDEGQPAAAEVNVTNIGQVDGSQVVQLYVAAKGADRAFRPVQSLAGYAKVPLRAGETKRIRITLSDHAFSVYSPREHRWVSVADDYQLRFASSSRDVEVTLEVPVPGEIAAKELEAESAALPHYVSGHTRNATDAEFADLLGRTPPATTWDPEEPLNPNSVLDQVPGHSVLGNALHSAIVGTANALDRLGKPIAANYARFTLALPLRSMAVMSGGKISESTMNTAIAFLNGEGLSWLHGKK